VRRDGVRVTRLLPYPVTLLLCSGARSGPRAENSIGALGRKGVVVTVSACILSTR
jgi:hypothetical protein